MAYTSLSLAGFPPTPLRFIAGLGLIFLGILYYFTLTLMLGALFDGRGPVIGIPIALVMGYQFIAGIAPAIIKVMPWGFTMSAGNTPLSPISMLMLGQPFSATLPVIATILQCVLFTVVAIWRFNREQF